MNLKIKCILFIFICIVIYYVVEGFKLPDESISYDIMVHDFGAQLVIDNINTYQNTGDVYNSKFIWSHEYNPYTGIYHLDTGSHLLIDMVSEIDKETIETYLIEDNIEFLEYDGNYRYVQGGTNPFMINQDIDIQKNTYKYSPVGLMSIYGQPAMIKERNQVNGLFGLSMINETSNNYKHSSLNILLKDKKKKTLLLDFKNKKLITGIKRHRRTLGLPHQFKGKIDSDSDLLRLDVWVEHNGNQYKILIDTGTLYSQFKLEGSIELNGINEKKSYGKLILNNARVLPEELVGNKPVIMGFNDLKNGQLFIDFDNLMVYIDQ